MRNYNIVIIDDEEDILNLLRKYFDNQEIYNIKTFQNPIEGYNFIKNNNVDLCLVDIMMPEMDGIELLEKVKKEKPQVKVIMMTAFSSLDKVLDTYKLGAEGYIMKPFDSLKALNNKIIEILSKKK